MEEQSLTQSIQQMILSNVITAGDQSTFIKCLSDNDDSAVNDIRNYAQSVGDRVKDPAVKRILMMQLQSLKRFIQNQYIVFTVVSLLQWKQIMMIKLCLL